MILGAFLMEPGIFNISKHTNFYFYLHTMTFMTPGQIAAALLQLMGILLNSSEKIWLHRSNYIHSSMYWLRIDHLKYVKDPADFV